MDARVTEWFDADVKPALPGWYEREYRDARLQREYDWWDGGRWYTVWLGKKQPATIPRRWRGLAECPGH